MMVAGIEKIERDRVGVGYRIESAIGRQEGQQQGPQHGRQQGWQEERSMEGSKDHSRGCNRDDRRCSIRDVSD